MITAWFKPVVFFLHLHPYLFGLLYSRGGPLSPLLTTMPACSGFLYEDIFIVIFIFNEKTPAVYRCLSFKKCSSFVCLLIASAA